MKIINKLRRIRDKMRKIILYYKWLLMSKYSKKPILYYLGTAEHGNYGDQAIAIATRMYFKDKLNDYRICEIPFTYLNTKSEVMRLRNIIGKATILVHGGGYMGTTWMDCEVMARNIIVSYPENRIIILPQTIYFEDTLAGDRIKKESSDIYQSHPDLWVCTREDYSYKLAKEELKLRHVLLVPDMVTYMNWDKKFKRGNTVYLCLRSDREKVLKEDEWEAINQIVQKQLPESTIEFTDTVVPYGIKNYKRIKPVNVFLELFSKSKLVITDRLHGMVFAAITGTPCVTLSNHNYKVKGVYRWIANNRYIKYIDSVQALDLAIREVIKETNTRYSNEHLLSDFDVIEACVREHNQ